MNKQLCIVFILVILASCAPSDQQSPQIQLSDNLILVTIHSNTQNIIVQATIADTPESQQQGLMNVPYLAKDRGMLFIFQDEQIRRFWMKNTLIPLDIIFINNKKQIVSISSNAQPAVGMPYEIFESQGPAQYVLEVTAGFTQDHQVKPGDQLSW